jgi:hypothetical protein
MHGKQIEPPKKVVLRPDPAAQLLQGLIVFAKLRRSGLNDGVA